MTAAGKITAARVTTGDRILVKHYTTENEEGRTILEFLEKGHALGISSTKTGEGVTVARVLYVEAKTVTGGRRDRRVYDIYTTEGVLANNAPAQTLILAPEDAAGIKRAHVEALALDATYEAYPVAETETPATEPVTEDQAYEAQEAEVAATWITVPRQNGKTASAAETEPAGGYLEPAEAVRTRYHGKTLTERRKARKNARAARRRTRSR